MKLTHGALHQLCRSSVCVCVIGGFSPASALFTSWYGVFMLLYEVS